MTLPSWTPEEQEEHRREYYDALIEHADEQITGNFGAPGRVCAVGCAMFYTSFQRLGYGFDLQQVFQAYYGLDTDEIVGLNETRLENVSLGMILKEYHDKKIDPLTRTVVNMTFPEIVDELKNRVY